MKTSVYVMERCHQQFLWRLKTNLKSLKNYYAERLKTYAKKLWYWDVVICKWVNFSFKCFLSNVEEINLLLSLFKKAKNNNFDFCY